MGRDEKAAGDRATCHSERATASRGMAVLPKEGPLYQDPHFVVGGVGDSGLAGARPKIEQLVWARRVHRAEA